MAVSSEVKGVFVSGVGAIFIVVAILIALWGLGFMAHNVGVWWKDVTYVKQEQETESDRQRKLDDKLKELDIALKDPTSKESKEKRCQDAGGYPGWDGWGNMQCHEMEKDK